MTPDQIASRLRTYTAAFSGDDGCRSLVCLLRSLASDIEADAKAEEEARERARREHEVRADRLQEWVRSTPINPVLLPEKPIPAFQVGPSSIPTVVHPPCWAAPVAKPDTVEIGQTTGPRLDFPFQIRS